jgi:hypothetical protein
MIPKYDHIEMTLRGINGDSDELILRAFDALTANGVPLGEVNQFLQAATNAPDYDSLAHIVALTVNLS